MAGQAFRTWHRALTQTGDLGPVAIGMSRAELRTMFGDPDDVGCGSRQHPVPTIWLYDGLEFHFATGRDGGLMLVFRDDVNGVITCIPGAT